MAVQFYIDQSSAAPQGDKATEDIFAGEIVAHSSIENGLVPADAQDADPEGLALFSEEFMVGEDEDDVVQEKYQDNDNVRFAPLHGALVGFGRTLEDEGGAAPAVSHRDVVGLVDTSAQDAPAGAKGRLVQEGYSNGGTTFQRGNDNFLALGKAYRPARNGNSVTEYDDVLRVDFFSEAQE